MTDELRVIGETTAELDEHARKAEKDAADEVARQKRIRSDDKLQDASDQSDGTASTST